MTVSAAPLVPLSSLLISQMSKLLITRVFKNGSRLEEVILSALAQARGGYPGGRQWGTGLRWLASACSIGRSPDLLPCATPMIRWHSPRTEVGELAQLRSGVRVAAPAFGFAGGFW